MAVSWDMPSAHGEQGRVYGQKDEKVRVSTARPPLPPSMAAGSHGGSHGHLTSEFCRRYSAGQKTMDRCRTVTQHDRCGYCRAPISDSRW